MNCTDAFTKELKTRITYTRTARGGKGIYKRRNSRANRAIIHYKTYLKIIKNNEKILDNYKRGYVVRVKPNEYFDENGNINNNFSQSLKIGVNAFIYFKTIEDWNKYKSYCSNFKEIVELYTRSKSVANDDQWIGDYCKFIKNTDDPIVSLICTTKKEKKDPKYKQELKELKNIYKKLPEQAGLGNSDIDYAPEEEIEKVFYQLSMMIFRVPDMKEELKARTSSLTDAKIKEVEKHIIDFCKSKKLYDLKKLENIRALDKKDHLPICPLCLEKLDAKTFFENADQDQGREEEDNTQSKIVLMHIEVLAPMKFNHRTYNLGWGHIHCNKIQGEYSINETLKNLERILENQSNS